MWKWSTDGTDDSHADAPHAQKFSTTAIKNTKASGTPIASGNTRDGLSDDRKLKYKLSPP
jgi:hypothetical protein